ncbi:MAG: TIGR03087 family PEP-CTERM/XrtA system glycosyltransferase [Gammaproteobacteria bacterium]|nr:TIGR03087 family PEP-CTERM/XrtA system glycosyltransferase [Gammaproteobacteria bacterium]
MKKQPLLFLCHRIPFPPNKGDKIATFNLLKFLARRYDVHLGFFIDDPFDQQYVSELEQYCVSHYVLDICDRRQLSSGVKALLSGTSVSQQHLSSSSFQAWVDQTIDTFEIENLFIYSSAMSQFIEHPRYQDKIRVLDMADIDSDKWRQYAMKKPWYSQWIYTREQRLLAQLEQQSLVNFTALTLVTPQETALFKKMSPSKLAYKIHTLRNGVDTKYFSPLAQFDYSEDPIVKQPAICFTGVMDYWANVDAMVWFCEQVWPRVLEQQPNAHFYIVGGSPTDKVKKLAKLPGVHVTGRVADVRPFVASAAVVVAPMQIARGIQNKVLEAMAMAKPVIMTTMGFEGISLDRNQLKLVTDDPAHMAELIIEHLATEQPECTHNRQWIVDRYSWSGALEKLPRLLTSNQEVIHHQ